ncbi:3-deoxy-manno-octulosonate cytidylyltransferase [Aliiglaciecola lipolytica]|uniref:3-deoxy-manno-octulosonate cytidylyltransferase n=1 Tax=Aliiglaciecola lipolytica TaxID=477689 RepID=UPI001C0A52E8|nr:3-deoxy-manno-octulosonate cytidylyltransferase [Aliiglaciecola lipolytica]MBU2877762.1 3-deoxy-manno-octulosonate cytidylyltransferase [Aliiglaciecola lipolytica]
MNFHIVIPARFNSSRLPGKPLLDLHGRPMIWHVYQRALESGFKSITIATDDSRIFKAVSSFGGNVLMTKDYHESGTDRLAEVAELKSFCDSDIVINLQGDEPLVPAKCITKLADTFQRKTEIDIATLSAEITDNNDIFNSNVVKVVTDLKRKALYFSRAPIPWHRDNFEKNEKHLISRYKMERHIGMYAYRVDQLKTISKLAKSPLEEIESLEQLRAIENGLRIYVNKLEFQPPHGVDTIDDYEKLLVTMSDYNDI